MRNHQKTAGNLGPDGYVSIFLVGMIRIINRDTQSVPENGGGLAEGNTMLPEVRFSFVKIPFELDHDSVFLPLG